MKLRWDPAAKAEGGYQRERSSDLYHTARWTRLARRFKDMHPLCEECLKEGLARPAEATDHIVPWPICQDFFDESNLQSLCAYHNMMKGERDRKKIQEWKRTHPPGENR